MRFTTQTTTTINPMIPRTNQIVLLIFASSAYPIHHFLVLGSFPFGGFPPNGSALPSYSGVVVVGPAEYSEGNTASL
jgi:hypothetical protein